ncbi:hypothetical protein BH09GEM1_BH09GEM1_11920 [soil metagenome]
MKELQALLAPTIVELWSSMLALEAVEQLEDVVQDGAPTFVGCVHLAGTTAAVVVMHIADALARRAAGTMFNVAPDEVTDADVRDAVGELTNVTAGNLKGALAEPYLLSLPTVVAGRDLHTFVTNARLVARTAFRCHADHFTVSVFAQQLAPR